MDKNPCVFCSCREYVSENKLAFAIYDKYPVSPGHILIIPKRHVSSFFATTAEEEVALLDLLAECREVLIHERQPDGFNIGINDGQPAGQTVMHLHIHLIPRYTGDIENPKGGVRGVIPEKRVY